MSTAPTQDTRPQDTRPQDAAEIADLPLVIESDDAEQVKGGAVRRRTEDPDAGGEISRP